MMSAQISNHHLSVADGKKQALSKSNSSHLPLISILKEIGHPFQLPLLLFTDFKINVSD